MWLCFLIVGVFHGAIAQEVPKFQIGPHISLVKPFGEHEIKESNNEATYLASSQRRWGIELGADAFYALDSNYRIAGGMGYHDIAHGFILDSEEPNGLLELTETSRFTDFYSLLSEKRFYVKR